MNVSSLGSLSNLDAGTPNNGSLSNINRQSSQILDLESLGPLRRKLLDDTLPLVTEEFLEKTRVKLKNVDHARVLHTPSLFKLTS